MTTWLWIIGITAVLWPVIVMHFFEGHLSRNSEVDSKAHERNRILLDQRANAVGAEISGLQTIIEQQDALIALLWYKVFGLGHQERFGKAELAEFFHQSPKWYVDAMELPGAYDTLCRHENYPWGKHAEWLRREDFRD